MIITIRIFLKVSPGLVIKTGYPLTQAVAVTRQAHEQTNKYRPLHRTNRHHTNINYPSGHTTAARRLQDTTDIPSRTIQMIYSCATLNLPFDL